MVQPMSNQKVEETASCEEVLFNSDTLSKIISYLPSVDLLNLAVTCKRFGIASGSSSSLIEESARIAIQDIATEEQLAALPRYDGENSLADYHNLQLMREPLTFDQLVGGAEYVNIDDKSCVRYSESGAHTICGTALSNNILRGGKHYVSFKPDISSNAGLMAGVIRPGQANQNASGSPLTQKFFQNFVELFSRCGELNTSNQCGMYHTYSGDCFSSNWVDGSRLSCTDWDGMESMSTGDELGMLLDLDEGTLSVYKNGRKLGIMKRGLVGPYCWVVGLYKGSRVTIKRGVIPPG